jgi:hypothetical protein
MVFRETSIQTAAKEDAPWPPLGGRKSIGPMLIVIAPFPFIFPGSLGSSSSIEPLVGAEHALCQQPCDLHTSCTCQKSVRGRTLQPDRTEFFPLGTTRLYSQKRTYEKGKFRVKLGRSSGPLRNTKNGPPITFCGVLKKHFL